MVGTWEASTMVNFAELRRDYEILKDTELSKDKIIEGLFYKVEGFQRGLQHKNNELQDQKKLVQVYRGDAEKCQSELDAKSRKEARLEFALVLVDGDHMNFMDEFVQDGQKGGRSAAKALMEAVQDHVQKIKPDASPNIQYKIRVYANVTGLAKDSTWKILCEFVDAGNGKECSDAKIRALFEHYFLDIHCQHIVFCASADNGYARVLGSHRESNRISLVEGPPFAHELIELASEFEITSFPGVFRSEKLKPSKRVTFGGTSATPTLTPPHTPTPNYASIARTVPQRPDESPQQTNTSTNSSISLVVCKNANGERVDSPLQYSTKSKLDALKQHKFCNQFHILGSCFWGEPCTHKHEPRLIGQGVVDLMQIARSSACPKGLRCDERCVSGHQCPYKGCMVKLCKFPHDADIRIVTPS